MYDHISCWPMAGQVPHQGNAAVIAGRLMRRAEKALILNSMLEMEACLDEHHLLTQLAEGGKLPPGPGPSVLSPPQETPKATPAPTYTSFQLLYFALAGRLPAGVPAHSRFRHPRLPGRWYFLAPQGKLFMGLSPRRSLALPKEDVEALKAQAREALSLRDKPKASAGPKAPRSKPILTVADLEGLLS